MVRAAGPRGRKAAGAGEAWALAGSVEDALAVVAADSEAVEADSVVVDLAGGGDVSEILFAEYNGIQFWRKSYVASRAGPKSFGFSFRDLRSFVLGYLFARLLWKGGEPQNRAKDFFYSSGRGSRISGGGQGW